MYTKYFFGPRKKSEFIWLAFALGVWGSVCSYGQMVGGEEMLTFTIKTCLICYFNSLGQMTFSGSNDICKMVFYKCIFIESSSEKISF